MHQSLSLILGEGEPSLIWIICIQKWGLSLYQHQNQRLMINYQTTDTISDKELRKEMNNLKDRFCGFKFFDSRYSRTWTISDVVLADNGQIQMITQSGDKTQYTNEADLRFHGRAGQYIAIDIANLLN